MPYKIRIKGTHSYSHGVITQFSYRDNIWKVRWSSKGKLFPNELSVKNHLMRAAEKGILGDWEVIEIIEQPTKPLDEWVDQKMLMKLIKTKGGNK